MDQERDSGRGESMKTENTYEVVIRQKYIRGGIQLSQTFKTDDPSWAKHQALIAARSMGWDDPIILSCKKLREHQNET